MIFKPLHILFHKIHGYIKIYDKSKYLTLIFNEEKNQDLLKIYGEMFDEIKYFIKKYKKDYEYNR